MLLAPLWQSERQSKYPITSPTTKLAPGIRQIICMNIQSLVNVLCCSIFFCPLLSLPLSPSFHFPLPTSLQWALVSSLQPILMSYGNRLSSYPYDLVHTEMDLISIAFTVKTLLDCFPKFLFPKIALGSFGSTTMCHEVSGLCGVDRCVGQSCDHTQKAGPRIR